MNIKGKSILITGGAGFLGSHLAEEMVAEGARVTIYDNLLLRTHRIDHLLKDQAVQLIDADLLDDQKVVKAVEGKAFIWHLGGNTDIPAGLRDPSLDLKNGVVATHHLLEAMRKTGVRSIAFPSSGAIYGEKTNGFRSEKDGPTLPISLYGAGKLACEGFISAYAHLFGIQAWIFRFGNVIGGRISHGAIRDFIQKLRKNPRQIEILGDGTQTKSYLLVEECVVGMQFVIEHTLLEEGEGFCDVFNLGAPDESSAREIVNIVIEEMGLEAVEVRAKGGERGWPGDQAKIALDISKVKAMGWKPKHTSSEAVRIAVRRMLQQVEV